MLAHARLGASRGSRKRRTCHLRAQHPMTAPQPDTRTTRHRLARRPPPAPRSVNCRCGGRARRSCEVRACKRIPDASPMHSVWRFLGIAAHPSKFWQVPIELGREKTMYMHGANYRLALLRLGPNRGQLPPTPRHHNLPVERCQNMSQ